MDRRLNTLGRDGERHVLVLRPGHHSCRELELAEKLHLVEIECAELRDALAVLQPALDQAVTRWQSAERQLQEERDWALLLEAEIAERARV